MFDRAIEHMFDHGEKVVRSFFEKIPDGRYVGRGEMDGNGVTEGRIPFEVIVEVNGSDVSLDFTGVPEQQVGPVNCPLPSTISSSRVAISMLAGHSEAPNEGHFRAIEVRTRPGTMFHPLPPAPCFIYGWAALQAIEVIYHAISKAVPSAVPAQSGGCICSCVWWGTREKTGEPWADGSPHPVGQGAFDGGDGGVMLHIAEVGDAFLAARSVGGEEPLDHGQDGAAAGLRRAGQVARRPGIDFHFRMTETTYVTTVVERTLNAPWGLEGGGFAAPNDAEVRHAGRPRHQGAQGDALRDPAEQRAGDVDRRWRRLWPAVGADGRSGREGSARGIHLGGFRPTALPARGVAAGREGPDRSERRVTLRFFSWRLILDRRGLFQGFERILDGQEDGRLDGAQRSAGADRKRGGRHRDVVRSLPQVVPVVIAEGIPEPVQLSADPFYVLLGRGSAILGILDELRPCGRCVAEPCQV